MFSNYPSYTIAMSDATVTPKTPHELFELLQLGVPKPPTAIDTSSLRYVIYARKSTTGDERQERSIPDQVKDCIDKVVKIDGLKVVGSPIEEKCSAKDPDIRPKFKQLLEDVRSGKIDGIITWHPDRLSRNMKEAGEIIDLLDKGILKDLRFATSTFENSPTGKMLLGISFVLSKQYSEHLSESVTRGNRRKTEDGYFFDEMKHGYFISDGRLYPDGESFALIQEAFRKRLEGISQPDIAMWLNSTDYKIRKKGKDPVPYKWDKGSVSKMLRDPLYAGVLKYGNSFAVLEDFYDFTPVLSVEAFFKLNKVKDFYDSKLVSAVMSKGRNTKANLLRGIVACGYCNKPFSSGLTPKKLKDGVVHYYFYKCETDGCEFKNKSVRAKHVLNYAYEFLNTHLFVDRSSYDNYVLEARGYAAAQASELSSDIMRLTKLTGDKRAEYDRTKQLLLENPALKEHYDLDSVKGELDTIIAQHKSLMGQKAALKEAILTYKEYLELFKGLSVKLQDTHDIELIDQVLRNFFSNFTVKQTGIGKQQRREITSKLKEPWLGFFVDNKDNCGRG